MELRGTEGGKRARLRNLLPRYADRAATMSATLPAAVLAAYGEVVVDGSAGGSADAFAPAVPEDRLGQMEDILIGAKNLVTLAAYVREERPFEDADIPQETFAVAVAAADRLLADADEGEVRKAKGERCRRLLSKAADMDEMRTFASSPACNDI